MALSTLLWMVIVATVADATSSSNPPLRFNEQGKFKILQIADMHYANGQRTRCKDVRDYEVLSCSDLNSTAFLTRLLAKERPDLVVFTGDNIDGGADDAAESMNAVFAPVMAAKIPWAAILGNHDDESNLARPDLMGHITSMEYSLARTYPKSLNDTASGQDNYLDIDGFGNYHLEVLGALTSGTANTGVLNLFFLDSGAYSKVPGVDGYDWIRASQQIWFEKLSKQVARSVPGLVYFHIPLPEYDDVRHLSTITGQHQEAVCSASLNSGFFTSMLEAGNVKVASVGHDHVNDYCGNYVGIQLCYGGGAGYHAYGKPGWARRARVLVASLGEAENAGEVEQISTWKVLDDTPLSYLHEEVLWDRQAGKAGSGGPLPMWRRLSGCSAGALIAVVVAMGIPLLLSGVIATCLYDKYRRLKEGYVRLLDGPMASNDELKPV